MRRFGHLIAIAALLAVAIYFVSRLLESEETRIIRTIGSMVGAFNDRRAQGAVAGFESTFFLDDGEIERDLVKAELVRLFLVPRSRGQGFSFYLRITRDVKVAALDADAGRAEVDLELCFEEEAGEETRRFAPFVVALQLRKDEEEGWRIRSVTSEDTDLRLPFR